jgi:hypothetical protein
MMTPCIILVMDVTDNAGIAVATAATGRNNATPINTPGVL